MKTSMLRLLKSLQGIEFLSNELNALSLDFSEFLVALKSSKDPSNSSVKVLSSFSGITALIGAQQSLFPIK